MEMERRERDELLINYVLVIFFPLLVLIEPVAIGNMISNPKPFIDERVRNREMREVPGYLLT